MTEFLLIAGYLAFVFAASVFIGKCIALQDKDE